MNPIAKLGWVLAGYLGALLAAGLTFYYCQARAAAHPDLYSSGMSAGGDSILILGVLGFACLFPTALALYYLRAVEKFWRPFSLFCLALSLTAPLAEALNSATPKLQLYQNPEWVLVGFLALLRVGGTLIFAPGFILFALLSPEKKARLYLLAAAGIEIMVFLYAALHFLLWNRLS